MDQQNVGSKRGAASGAEKIAAKSHDAAEQMKDAVVGQVNQVRERALSAQGDTSDRIRGVAGHLRDLGDTLRDQDPTIARLAQRAGEGVEGLARYVGDASPQSIIRDTEQLARRQPALFFGSAFLLGLAAARFIKSARPEGYTPADDRSDNGGTNQQRLERQSGFFPADRNARSNQRFQENYDSTFGRDEQLAPAGGVNRVVPPVPPAPPRPVLEPPSERRNNDTIAESTRKGNVS